MERCSQRTITGLAFEPLIGIRELVYRDGERVTYSYPSGLAGGAPLAGPLHEFVISLNAAGEPDFGPRIRGPLCLWRAANPTALVAHVGNRKGLTDADFAYLRGIRALNMSWCNQPTITDAAFANLGGIHTLDMSHCYQRTITDAAFANLRGIHTLNMRKCDQDTITDAAFANLRGIQRLEMGGCFFSALEAACALGLPAEGVCSFGPIIEGSIAEWRAANPTALVANVRERRDLTDADFLHFRGIRYLDMSECNQPAITDAAFANLHGIHTLNMEGCHQPTITDAAFANLPVAGIHTFCRWDGWG